MDVFADAPPRGRESHPSLTDLTTRVMELTALATANAGEAKIRELERRGFALGPRYRRALSLYGVEAFEPRPEFLEFATWRLRYSVHPSQLRILVAEQDTTYADMMKRMVAAKQYPGFHGDWLGLIERDSKHLGPRAIVAPGSQLVTLPGDPSGAQIPWAIHEPSMSSVGVLGVCEIVTPFPAGTGFLVIDFQ